MAARPLLSRLPKGGILRNQGGAPAILASLRKCDSCCLGALLTSAEICCKFASESVAEQCC